MPESPAAQPKSDRPITAPAAGAIGCVALVGAGTGDPGLITVRGAELLRRADVVVYDRLADPRLLDLAPTARHVYVGKKSADHAMPQPAINDLLIAEARAGGRVVRLKGGDPFVFARGAEECEALAHAGVSFEVVPGITAAIAAPAYAGIPVTHRQFNSTFTLVTGHPSDDSSSPDLDWATLAKLPCLAFYMGTAALPRICAQLIEHGMDPATPAATIQWGTLPAQRTVVATLRDLSSRVLAEKLGPPAITIVGRNVALRDSISWFERRPLFGKTVVVTRTRHQAGELSQRLADLGANVIEAGAIELVAPIADAARAVDHAIRSLTAQPADWLVFTSVNGVNAVRDRLAALHLDARSLGPARIAAIGSATAAAVARHLCLRVDLCPAQFTAEALADALLATDVRAKRIFALRADIARPVLIERLTAAGATVQDIAVYETRRPADLPPQLRQALAENRVDWIAFASSGTVRNFLALLGPAAADQLRTVRIASIGPITSAALREFGLQPTVQADPSTIPALADAIAAANSR